MQLTRLRYLNAEAPLASGNCFLSAASGLARMGAAFWVVADDDVHLARFDGDSPGTLIRMLPDVLPQDARARKKAKPDFEILLSLDEDRLLAMGSGSTKRRKRGVLVDLSGIPPVT